VADCDPALAYRIEHDTFPIITDPEFVPVSEAGFMRADDWIVGVRTVSGARCYPAFMLDNVHVVNDTIDGVHYAVMHCEICCSNAVFLADYEGRRLTFGTGGLFGGTLSLFDEQSASLWSHGMGVAFDGPLVGAELTRVESFQATYEECLSLYPDTEVMAWSAPETHPDARHGHGTDAWFAKPGIEPLVLRTMSVVEDDRLPENEMVVSVFTAAGHTAVPLRTVMDAGGLIQGTAGGEGFVMLSAGPDSSLTGTFLPRLEGQPETAVELEFVDGRIIDRGTGSWFRVDGEAAAGPLVGRRLVPLPTMTNKWHSLTCFVPDIPIVHLERRRRQPGDDPLRSTLESLLAEGLDVTPTRRLYALELPSEAMAGYELDLDGDPFLLLLFSDESVARDQLLWTPHAIHEGTLILASAPPLYSDSTNTKRYRPREIAWSDRVRDPAVRVALARAAAEVPPARHYSGATLTDMVDRLRSRGTSVQIRRASYRETLPVGALSGMVVDLEGDPFVAYRFESAADAASRAPLPDFSIVVEHMVLQSDPADLYANLARGTQRRPDDLVSWSPLLESPGFRKHVADSVLGTVPAT
jgi:hypothetical protein